MVFENFCATATVISSTAAVYSTAIVVAVTVEEEEEEASIRLIFGVYLALLFVYLVCCYCHRVGVCACFSFFQQRFASKSSD